MRAIEFRQTYKKSVRVQAIGDLLEYLDSNLLTLNKNLLKTNFDRILASIWKETLEEFKEVMDTEEMVSTCRSCVFSFFSSSFFFSSLYSAILRSRADSLRSHVFLHERLAFHSALLNIHRSGVLTALAWLVPHETAAVSAQVLCTPYSHAPCHFMQSHTRKVHACLSVTSPLILFYIALFSALEQTRCAFVTCDSE